MPLSRRHFLAGATSALALPSLALAAPGPLIAAGRNRRANWHPQHLSPSVLKAWWCADDHGLTGMTDDGAGLISLWTDRFNGIALAAATTVRPTWAATGFTSSLPGITFDGVANCLRGTTGITSLPTGAAGGETWAAWESVGAASGTQTIADYGSTTNGQKRNLRRASTERLEVSDGLAAFDAGGAGGVTSGANVAGGNWLGTTEGGRINGAVTSPATATIGSLNTGTTRMAIGSSNNVTASLFGHITVRHIIITTILALADRQRLEGWLAWDCGLTAKLPTTHPYKTVRP